MKLIRAKRDLWIPRDPEKPDNNMMRLVQTGLIAIIPGNFRLPDGSYTDMGKLKLKDQKDE